MPPFTRPDHPRRYPAPSSRVCPTNKGELHLSDYQETVRPLPCVPASSLGVSNRVREPQAVTVDSPCNCKRFVSSGTKMEAYCSTCEKRTHIVLYATEMQSSHKGCSPDNRTDVPNQGDALQVLILINGKRVMQIQQYVALGSVNTL